MKERKITSEQIRTFEAYLQAREHSCGTVTNYLRDIRAFAEWLDGCPVTKQRTTDWKEHLRREQYAPTTVNSMLAAVNAFFSFTGWTEFRVQFLKIQRRMFRDAGRELSRAEYERLVVSARQLGRERLALLMEAICATGIRVSEVRYLTVEAAQRGIAEIALKGKIRTILLPTKLCRKLLKYAKNKKIASGEIFLTRSGKSLSRRQIWLEMKRLCGQAGVAPGKVFPHNLRHLFAVTYYKVTRDIVQLADVLGHSSVETTRIYLLTTGVEHLKCLNRMCLVS